jgi:hypothetical protein
MQKTTKLSAPPGALPNRIGTPFTFSNGFEVWLKPIPADMGNDLQRMVKKPEPPVQMVTSLNGEKAFPNPDHPAYIPLLEEWEKKLEEERIFYMLFWCVAFDFTDEMRAQVQEIRAEMREYGGLELHHSDKVVYITKILATPNDFTELMKEISRNGLPSQEEVAEMVSGFRDNGQRATIAQIQTA